jgi:hypothetical protein
LEVEACQELFRRLGQDPLMKLWIEQQLRHHRLDPALVWRIVGLAQTPTTGGLRTVAIPPRPHNTDDGGAPCQAS